MRAPKPRIVVACLAMSLAANARSFAQSPASTIPAAHCDGGSPIVGGATGAAVGAFLGLVGAKIRWSDWNDASRTPAEIGMRNRVMIGSAVVGAVLGSLAFRQHRCAASSAAAPPPAPRPGWLRPIRADEIAQSGVTGSVYDLVYSLRRNWLYAHDAAPMAGAPDGAVPGQQIVIYEDDVRLGDLSRLREVPVAGVVIVRYFDPAEATYRWGGGNSQGVIQVLTVAADDDS